MADTTQTDICNGAIDKVAGKIITSIDSGTLSANACKRSWATALKDTLSKYKWPFAKVVEALVEVSNYTPLEWEYAYAFPSKSVRNWLVYNELTVDKTIGEEFTEEYDKTNNQKVIVTNVEDAYVEYSYYVTDVSIFDHAFVKTLEHRLAAEIAMPLTGDIKLAEAQIVLFNGAISEAERLASYGHNPPKNPPNLFVDSRS